MKTSDKLPISVLVCIQRAQVTVQFRCATSDLMLIQQKKFYWISDRSMVAHRNCTVTACAYHRRPTQRRRTLNE